MTSRANLGSFLFWITPTLEQKHPVVLQLTKRDSVAALIESSQPLEESSSASAPQCIEEESDSLSNSDIDTVHTRNTNTRSQTSSTANSSNRESAVLSPEKWKTGVSTNTLVARLQTNPTTLRKYLRNLKQLQWAMQRDPQHLGWRYDPLLERYFPVQPSLHNSSTQTSVSSNPENKEQQKQNHINEVEKLESTQGSNTQIKQKGGLTQSQLSRLTGIPVNTLRRWKQLSECSELIRCRTEGEFVYWYSQQNKRFYEINSSLPYYSSIACFTSYN